MASVKLYLDTRVPRKDGTFPLKIAVTHKSKFLINLKIYLKEDQFIGNEVVGHKSKKTYNIIIDQWLVNIKKILLDLGANGKLNKLSHQQLKEIIENFSGSDEINEEEEPYLFKDHFDKFLSRKDNPRTIELYQGTYNKIIKASDIDALTFEDINVSWLKDFQQRMANDALSINAQAIHFRNIRTLFNDAIDEDLISQNTYPFRRFKIKTEKTIKRSLTVEELLQLRDYPCEEYLEKYRDLFMLIFYLIGINIIDLLHLKEIRNNKIEYRRAKTGRLYSIEVLPEAKKIFDKYKGKAYLLDVLDVYNNYKDFTHRLNLNLKRIGPVEVGKKGKKEIKSLFPDISTYYARHRIFSYRL